MFAVFYGEFFYPQRGWLDYSGSFPTVDAAMAYITLHVTDWDWYQVVNLITKTIECSGQKGQS